MSVRAGAAVLSDCSARFTVTIRELRFARARAGAIKKGWNFDAAVPWATNPIQQVFV